MISFTAHVVALASLLLIGRFALPVIQGDDIPTFSAPIEAASKNDPPLKNFDPGLPDDRPLPIDVNAPLEFVAQPNNDVPPGEIGTPNVVSEVVGEALPADVVAHMAPFAPNDVRHGPTAIVGTDRHRKPANKSVRRTAWSRRRLERSAQARAAWADKDHRTSCGWRYLLARPASIARRQLEPPRLHAALQGHELQRRRRARINYRRHGDGSPASAWCRTDASDARPLPADSGAGHLLARQPSEAER